MIIAVTRTFPCDVVAIRCEVAINYGDEDMPNDFPFRNGEMWNVTLDIETRRIRNWPAGRAETVNMKVCDQGVYTLLSKDGGEVAKLENDYVPACIPGEYGDYINFKIAPDGTLDGWNPTARSIKRSFFGDED